MVAATMRSDFPGEFQTYPALANFDYATVTIDEEGSLRFWALTAGDVEPRPGDTADDVLAAAFSPDGQFLGTGDDEGDGVLFPTVFRHELLRFVHLATAYFSHTKTPPKS